MLPIPVIIYRVRPEEAYQMGILADAIGDIGQLQSYLPPAPSAPALPILAALSTEEGLAQSAETLNLWLLHPQSEELEVYRGNPPLLSLKQSTGFYEAYLPHNSSPIPYNWYNEAQLKPLQDAVEASWLENPEKQCFLGVLGNSFFHWQKAGYKIFSGLSHAELPNKLKEAAELLEQVFVKSKEPESVQKSLVSLPLQNKWPGKDKKNESPAQLWLSEAQASLGQLHESFNKRVSKAAHTHLAQVLWALLAFWVSAKLNPITVLRKLNTWLEREKKHARLQKELRAQEELQKEVSAEAEKMGNS